MSIVEKAIEKLQKRAHAEQPRVAEKTLAAAVTTRRSPISHEALAAGASSGTARPHLTIDRDKLTERGILPPLSEQPRTEREFRHIKRPLVERALAARGDAARNASVIMVASAIAGEGKTFTAFNLALSLALEQDVSVLLIDADIPKPQISAVLGIEKSPGLLDAIDDPALDPEALIHTTDVPNLYVLGAGTHAETATEMLASQRMSELITRLRLADTSRIILFDSPPLLLTTESRELVTVAGQIVLVVRAGETPRQAVYDAIALFGETKHVGVVLNQVDDGGGDAAYYGYGQYGTYGERGEGQP
jgi:exopolysaccharide/PEP-CTERM locus tyrosine autokinase